MQESCNRLRQAYSKHATTALVLSRKKEKPLHFSKKKTTLNGHLKN